MDWTRFDRLRRNVGPVELDLVEAYAQKKIGRRDFVKRGSVIGLTAPFMGAIITACGGSDSDGATGGTDTGGETGGGTGATGGVIVAANQFGDANSGLDPLNMLDLGTYNVLSQSFEYLIGIGDDGNIANTALATEWSPNEDGSVWTFKLREGVTWHDGSDLTADDVVATFDRLAVANNAALSGVIAEGSAVAIDPLTVEFTLEGPNGNFPVLASIFNSQALITPADYTDGTTLDERKAGTGAWMLDTFDPTTFDVRFVPNPNWWGGEIALDGIELKGFKDIGTAVTAAQSGDVDAIQQFSVIGGEGLLNNPDFTVLTPPAANHRQVWFNVREGQFTDNRVRQALAYAVDREQMVSTLFSGQGEVANDHPVLSSLPFFDPDATPQRTYDPEMAKQLLSDAGVESITAVIESGDLQEIPDLAAIIQQNAAAAGFTLSSNVQSNDTFYGDSWCPPDGSGDMPCPGSSELGIVDYGHRPVPDVFFSSALATGGPWNSSNYASSEFDNLLTEYRSAIDVDSQKSVVGKIQQQLHEDTPAIYPYFYNYISGHSNEVSGMNVTALGQMIFSKATKG